MKKTIKLQFLVLALLTLISCGNDDDNNSSNDDSTSFVRAQFNGVAWESTQLNQATLLQDANFGEQRFDLNAENETYNIALAIAQSTLTDCMDVGSYTGDNNLIFLYTITSDGTSQLYHISENFDTEANDFQVNVTSCANGTISGTFQGTLFKQFGDETVPETIVVTNGEFQNISFTMI